MSDGVAVLGLASRGDKERLSIWVVEVAVDEQGDPMVCVRESWQATRGRDEASQLADAHQAIVNALDAPVLGNRLEGIALKRTEIGRGRPGNAYDRKIRFEGAAMLAALAKGRRYWGLRTNQLGPGADLAARALDLATAPDDEGAEAVKAACVALRDLP